MKQQKALRSLHLLNRELQQVNDRLKAVEIDIRNMPARWVRRLDERMQAANNLRGRKADLEFGIKAIEAAVAAEAPQKPLSELYGAEKVEAQLKSMFAPAEAEALYNGLVDMMYDQARETVDEHVGEYDHYSLRRS